MVVLGNVRIIRLISNLRYPLIAELRETRRLCASKGTPGIWVRIRDGRCLESVWSTMFYQVRSLVKNRRAIMPSAWQTHLKSAAACVWLEVNRRGVLVGVRP
jgi:hypothetical protein